MGASWVQLGAPAEGVMGAPECNCHCRLSTCGCTLGAGGCASHCRVPCPASIVNVGMGRGVGTHTRPVSAAALAPAAAAAALHSPPFPRGPLPLPLAAAVAAAAGAGQARRPATDVGSGGEGAAPQRGGQVHPGAGGCCWAYGRWELGLWEVLSRGSCPLLRSTLLLVHGSAGSPALFIVPSWPFPACLPA